MAGARSSCTTVPTTSTATAPSVPAPASPPGRAASAGPARRRAAVRGWRAAAVALGENSPRHLSADSLPLPGPQSLSLMVVRGAPSNPGWREGEGAITRARYSAQVSRDASLSQVCPSQYCTATGAPVPGRVTARSLRGLAAGTRALPRALRSGWLNRTRGGGEAGPLTSWRRRPASSPAHAPLWFAGPR